VSGETRLGVFTAYLAPSAVGGALARAYYIYRKAVWIAVYSLLYSVDYPILRRRYTLFQKYLFSIPVKTSGIAGFAVKACASLKLVLEQ